VFLQGGPDGLEVALATSKRRPNAGEMRRVWTARHRGRHAPVLMVVGYPAGADVRVAVCGPAGEAPKVVFDLAPSWIERVAAAALREPTRHAALRTLVRFELVGLEERLMRKIAQAAKTVGAGEVLPGSQVHDQVFAETREEFEGLLRENPALFVHASSERSVLSGEEYRQAVRGALEDGETAQRIRSLPWGAGSGMVKARPAGVQATYLFCARIADHPDPVFRAVTLVDPPDPTDGAHWTVDAEVLTCLALAQPPQEWDTPRLLDAETYERAFDAWEQARLQVVEGWNLLSDPATLSPEIHSVMRRAADVVRRHGPRTGASQEAIDAAVDALETPYGERTLRLFRDAVRHEDPLEQARLILELVEEQGLEPPAPPEPLPEIAPEDVHLICWLAITPAPQEAR
jgi:hypothetical protein